MRKLLLALPLSLLSVSLMSCTDMADGPSVEGDDPPLSSEADVRNPDKSPIPDDSKADEVYPAKFDIVADQSPVKSQGSRGVCSIFATTAQAENLYIKAGKRDADFSEQFLQWSVKRELGTFQNTSGSTGGDNLRSIVRYGTVDEAIWPYETQPWSVANDPACTAEATATQCHTNDEPPAAALQAERRKLPSSRWVNINSMKSHLVNKKTGLVVGFTFFYQSWNHRRSELPVNSDYWNQGYVTYPNAIDREKSLVKRAGHAVLVVGWDDNLEVGMRDQAGNPVLDAAGNPQKEKGFWLIKNSWGTTGFGISNPFGAGYGWLSMKYAREYGDAVIAEIPSLGSAAEVCDDTTNIDEDRDGKINCADSDCATHPSCSSTAVVKTYAASPALAIPDNKPAGISSKIAVTDVGTIGTAKLTVDISHSYRGDLKVVLTHDGLSPVVFNRTGGSADDLKASFDLPTLGGKALDGDWTLQVIDGASTDVGKLNSWQLDITTR